MNRFILIPSLLSAALAMPAIAFADGDHDHSDKEIITEGHVDILLDFNDDEGLHFAVAADDDHDHGHEEEGHDHDEEEEGHEHDHGELLHPDDIIIQGGIAGTITPALSFVGTVEDPFWFFPQVEEEGQPFPGFDTELLEGIFTGPVTIEFTAVELAGDFALYSVDAFGTPTVIVDFDAGLTAFDLPVDTHVHFVWAFSELGDYEIEMTALVDGVSTAEPGEFHFEIVPEPSVLSLLGLSGLALLMGLRRRA